MSRTITKSATHPRPPPARTAWRWCAAAGSDTARNLPYPYLRWDLEWGTVKSGPIFVRVSQHTLHQAARPCVLWRKRGIARRKSQGWMRHHEAASQPTAMRPLPWKAMAPSQLTRVRWRETIHLPVTRPGRRAFSRARHTWPSCGWTEATLNSAVPATRPVPDGSASCRCVWTGWSSLLSCGSGRVCIVEPTQAGSHLPSRSSIAPASTVGHLNSELRRRCRSVP